LGAEELSGDLPVFGGALRCKRCPATALSTLGEGSLREEGNVVFGMVMGGEVGGNEEIGGVIGKCMGGH